MAALPARNLIHRKGFLASSPTYVVRVAPATQIVVTAAVRALRRLTAEDDSFREFYELLAEVAIVIYTFGVKFVSLFILYQVERSLHAGLVHVDLHLCVMLRLGLQDANFLEFIE